MMRFPNCLLLVVFAISKCDLKRIIIKTSVHTPTKLPIVNEVQVHEVAHINRKAEEKAKHIFTLQNAISASPSVNAFVRTVNAIAAGGDPQENIKKDGDKCDENSFSNILCENDKLKFCGPNNQIMSIPCMVNGKQGFCNCEKTSCVSEKPACSEEKTECFQPNTKLPDNLDCHKFSYCNKNNQKTILQCPGNLIYDPNLEKCMDQNTARCNRVVCPRPGNTLQLIPFPQAKNYYVLCYKGMGDVRKCVHKFYAVRSNMCQFDCRLKNASGLFKDTNLEGCKKGIYYACRKAGTNFTTIQAKCPAGLTFDENLGLCTEEDTCTEPGNGN